MSEFTCWTCVRGLHMGTDGTNCVCCGDPFIGPMLGRFHDEPMPDPWCPHAHVTDDTSHGGHDTLCHDCGRAGV